MQTRYVLSIDGGGVRGIVAAVLLDVLEGEMRNAGYEGSIGNCFDVIAGTSTGSIIAAALAAPGKDANTTTSKDHQGPLRNPSQIRDIFRQQAKTIFPPRPMIALPIVRNIRQLFGPLYSPRPLQNILDDIFANLNFINPRRNLLITGYSIDPREAVFYRGGPMTPPGDLLCSGSITLKDAILGSTAAPTFLPPHEVVNPRSGKSQTIIDGGVFINNPSLAGFAEALRIYPDDDIKVISIGTGRLIQPFPFRKAKNWGFLSWVNPGGEFRTPLLSSIADGQARAVELHMNNLLGERFKRFDYDLSKGYGNPSLDDSSASNMNALERGALKQAEKMRPALKDIARELVRNRQQRDALNAATG